jgi:hypothetical protein
MEPWQLSSNTRTGKRAQEFDLVLVFETPPGRVSSEGPFRCSMPIPYGVSSSVPVEGNTVFEGNRIPISFDLPIHRDGTIPTVTLRNRLEARATDVIPGSGVVKRVAFSDGRTATVTEGESHGLSHRFSPPREIEVVIAGERQVWTR